jgi:hemerythrin
MAKFEWDSRLETGIGVIDEQHKELFKRIDQLELAIYQGKSRDELIKMMDFLDYYVEEHFNLEERVMKKNRYSDLAKHRLEHQDFRDTYEILKDEFKKKGTDSYLAIDVDKKIRNWWEHHVMEIDMAYVPVLKGKEWTIVRGE